MEEFDLKPGVDVLIWSVCDDYGGYYGKKIGNLSVIDFWRVVMMGVL